VTSATVADGDVALSRQIFLRVMEGDLCVVRSDFGPHGGGLSITDQRGVNPLLQKAFESGVEFDVPSSLMTRPSFPFAQNHFGALNNAEQETAAPGSPPFV
jgi:hypothetical protein